MTIRIAIAVPLLLPLAVAACAPGGGVPRRAQQQIATGDLEGARAALEGERQRNPRSVDVRVALGETYYRIARDALDRGEPEARYLAFLEHSVEEFVVAVEIDPRDERPHFYLAMIDTYRGDLRNALRGFDNARRLRPTGVAYTNIAEIFIYMGRIEKAYHWNELGLKERAPYSAILFNEMLLAWKEGRVAEARRTFADLRDHYPEAVGTINVAPLPEAPRRFEQFAGYCCQSPACGPYMEEACGALGLEVRNRNLSAEGVLQELRIEMERTRRLKEVYRQHKELDIEIEDPEPAAVGR